jgi:hypothetical protein
MAPRNNKNAITFNKPMRIPNRSTCCPKKNGASEKMAPNSIERKVQKIVIIPNVKATSLIRLTIKALIAALLAWIRVNQKLISKYEQIPTPSHPTNSCKRLSAVTKINIKNVKSDR